MSKAILNSRDKFVWDNCHAPKGANETFSTAYNVTYGEERVTKVYKGTQVLFEQLYDPNSEWNINASCSTASGAYLNRGGQRLTYFMACEPNTTYTISVKSWGDRFCVWGTNTLYTEPPSTWGTADTIYLAGSTEVPEELHYTFTTDSVNQMVYFYLNGTGTRPTGVSIVKSGTDTATPLMTMSLNESEGEGNE